MEASSVQCAAPRHVPKGEQPAGARRDGASQVEERCLATAAVWQIVQVYNTWQ